jgi:DNA polymerase-1
MELTGLDRKTAKNINFGLSYFMGIDKMAVTMGCSVEKCRGLVDKYFQELPFLKETRDSVVSAAKKKGYIRTVKGRRARLSMDMRKERKEYKIFNRLPQGSSADLLKTAMVESFRAGVWNTLKLHLTVHDELDFSIPDTKAGREAVKELKNIMENCIKLRVPIIADLEIGSNWSDVSEEKAKEFLST